MGRKLKEIDNGITKPQDYVNISFTNIADFNSAFTPNRIKLLSAIQKLKPKSIYELSKALDRDRRHIMRDISYLQNLGLIGIKRNKVNGRKVLSIDAPYNEIEIALKL